MLIDAGLRTETLEGCDCLIVIGSSMLIDAGLRTETPVRGLRVLPGRVQCSSTRCCLLKLLLYDQPILHFLVQCSSTRGCVLKLVVHVHRHIFDGCSMLIDAGLRTETFVQMAASILPAAFNAHRRGVAY